MAQITINIPDAQIPRLRAAIGQARRLKDADGEIRAATNQEARDWLIQTMKNVVRKYEKQAAVQNISITDLEAS